MSAQLGLVLSFNVFGYDWNSFKVCLWNDRLGCKMISASVVVD